jgi:hypothetical protein
MTTLTLSDQAVDLLKAGVTLERQLLETNRRTYRQQAAALETRHHMSTKQFLRRFHAGKLDDREVWFDWLFAHQAYTELSKRLAILRGIKL